MARGILPRTVDEVSSMYAQSKQKGVYLKHLQIAKNIGKKESCMQDSFLSKDEKEI